MIKLVAPVLGMVLEKAREQAVVKGMEQVVVEEMALVQWLPKAIAVL